MSARTRLAGGGALAALLVLALLGGAASPGFSIAGAPGAVAGAVVRVLRPPRPAPAAAPRIPSWPTIQASSYALGDIPADYLALYVTAAGTCPQLRWQVLAGIGKVESDHGRSPAPGVRSGINAFGCCSGPMQFNIRNGPPSTWDSYGDGHPDHVYDPRYAIPAAAAKLCRDGLATPHPPPTDPCPTVTGTPTQHQAIRHYNHACWYVHQVLTLAARYTTTPTPPAASDPFVVALAHNPHLATTTSGGCDPGPDLASGRLDLRVTSLLAVLAERYRLRSWWAGWTACRARCARPRSARRSRLATGPISATRTTATTSTSATAPCEPLAGPHTPPALAAASSRELNLAGTTGAPPSS